jgi:uncharacterized protein DUF397
MWRKSSRTGSSGNCVEVRNDLARLRDSKRPDVDLPATPAALARLVVFVRSGVGSSS